MQAKSQWIQIKNAIRTKYAWPGGYPLFAVMDDGKCLCMDCARQEFRQIARAHHLGLSNGWHVIGCDVNWEDDMTCTHCGGSIESAYA
jgi:hypothetical protein